MVVNDHYVYYAIATFHESANFFIEYGSSYLRLTSKSIPDIRYCDLDVWDLQWTTVQAAITFARKETRAKISN